MEERLNNFQQLSELGLPDFPAEEWSDEERFLLEPFFTNLDGHVTVIRNLPPELVGALCSKASRATGSLIRVFLNEYLKPILQGEDKKLVKDLKAFVAMFREYSPDKVLNNQLARKFYVRWLAEFGDDSIAQMTGVHVNLLYVSQVAMKFIEDQRMGLEPIEKSTRYVNYGQKVGGRYLYFIPFSEWNTVSELDDSKLYKETLDNLFNVYNLLVPKLTEWLKKNYEEKSSVLEKKAFDTLRGLLPMATVSQVAFRGNAQAWEYLVNRTARYPLNEVRLISSAIREELNLEIPSLMARLAEPKSQFYQAYLAGKREKAKKIAKTYESSTFVYAPDVALIEYDSDAEDKILAGIMFPYSNECWGNIIEWVKSLSYSEKEKIFDEYFTARTERWYKVSRAFENSYLRFEIVVNAGAYRDLHRHRMQTQDRQYFTINHGYDVPEEVVSAGMEKEFRAALDSVKPLFVMLNEKYGPELAQYVVPMAYRMRFYQWQNFRQFFWESELRTISQGHPDYRMIEQMKFKLVKEKFPLLAKYMKVDTKDYFFARRGVEEKIKAKTDKLLK
ncbi:MAG: FAD-dependent thymidylate synthase [Candidatus Brennerbacteria bacterium]|nr:FAD-dependent thymidylate synthase [Candidatus Brennerbacteria bacterium]